MRNYPPSFAVITAMILGGCSGSTIYKQSKFGNYDVLSVDAKQRLVIQGVVDNHPFICTEPSPDALVAQAAELAAAASAPIGGTTASAKLAGSFSETASTIGVRSQSIQLLRDGYFRLCEARMNSQITAEDYKHALGFIDEFIVTVTAIEALGGRVIAPAVLINAGGKATASDQTVEAGGGPANSSIGEIRVDTTGLNKEVAGTIGAILQNYYIRKAQYQGWITGKPVQ
jgi:hypothetical protein